MDKTIYNDLPLLFERGIVGLLLKEELWKS